MSAEIYDVFRDNLRRRMKEKNMSQADLARRIECTPGYVYQLLSGKANPGLPVVVKVADALDCEPDEMIRKRIFVETT